MARFRLRTFLGIDRSSAEHLLPDYKLRLAVNVVSDFNIGSKKKRPGYAAFGTNTTSKKVTGMHFWQKLSAGTTKKIVFKRSGTIIEKRELGTDADWVSVSTGWTDGTRTSFATFQGKIYASDGTDFKSSADGTTWAAVSNTSPQTRPLCKFLTAFKGRLYAAGSTADITPNGGTAQVTGSGVSSLYYSKLNDGSGWDYTSYLTDPTSPQYSYIDPDNNGYISGLAKILDRVIIFKNSAVYKWDGSTLTDLNYVPTTSNWAVIPLKDHLLFPNYDGIWDYAGTTPDIVSIPLGDIYSAITGADLNDMSGIVYKRHAYFSVGAITIEGETWNNVVLDLDFDQSSWYFHTFAHKPTSWIIATDENNIQICLFGDSAGNVFKYGSGTTDAGTPIQMVIQPKAIDGGTVEVNKKIDQLFVTADPIGEMKVVVSYDGGDWKPLGQLRKRTTNLMLKSGAWNKTMRIRLIDNSPNVQPVLKEISYDMSSSGGNNDSVR